MRQLCSFLLVCCLIGPASVLAQSERPNSDAITSVFEKVLRQKKDQWSKSNYNSMIFVPDAEMKQAVVFRQIKATSFDSISFNVNAQDKSKKFLYFFPEPV